MSVHMQRNTLFGISFKFPKPKRKKETTAPERLEGQQSMIRTTCNTNGKKGTAGKLNP